MIVSQNCIDFDTKTNQFGHISGPSYRGALASWRVGWLVRRIPAVRLEHTNASKTLPLRKKCVKYVYPQAESQLRNVKNVYPQANSALTTRTLKQKVKPTKGVGRGQEGVRRRIGRGQEGIKNVYP